jgi:hypothetical protein
MPERFTETMRAASEAGWSHAVQHRFVNELFAGAVPDAVMARYLVQDHRFLDSFLVLLGAALASADTFAARLRFGRFVGMVSAEENTYFLRAFEALGVSEARRAADPDTQATIGFKAGAVVVDQPAREADQDRRQGRQPRSLAMFQMAEVAVPRQMFTEILSLIARLQAPPAPA